MTVSGFCPHAKVKRSDCLVCVQEENRRAWRAELAREVLDAVMRNGELPIFRDETEIQMLTKLREIAGDSDGE